MKKIMTLFIVVALVASFGIGAIAGAGEDAFADAVINENAQLAYEKAAAEFAQGNDVEGMAAEENAEQTLAKTTMPFRNFMGAVNSAHYVRAKMTGSTCPTNGIKMPGRITITPNGQYGIVHYQFATWNASHGQYEICGYQN